MHDLRKFERGVALSGMENRREARYLPGKANTDYFVHNEADYRYFSEKGFTLIRLAFLWERLQPEAFGPLDKTHLGYLIQAADFAEKYGMRILPEPHSYGGRLVNGIDRKIGTPELPIGAFADFWGKVAAELKDHPGVAGYDLMNEPTGMPVTSSPATYHPTEGGVSIVNGDFTDGKAGWSMDDEFVIQPGQVVLKAAGGWANLTSLNTAGGGIPVKPGSVNHIRFTYKQKVLKGNSVRFRITYRGAYGKELLGKTLSASADFQSLDFTIVAPDDCDMIWLRFQNQNGTVEATFQDFEHLTSSPVEKTVATMTLANQAAINAIRAAGSKQWIVLEFDRYTGLARFVDNFGANPKVWWSDPLNKTLPSFHYYMDPDYSGTYSAPFTPACATRMPEETARVLEWAEANGVRVFMGEYGVPSDMSESSINYRTTLNSFLSILDAYEVSGTYWAAGRGYTSAPTIHPTENYTKDREVMSIALKHLGGDLHTVEKPIENRVSKLPEYDFTNKSYMFQDLEGAVPAVVGKKVAMVMCSAGSGYRLIQETERSRPTLQAQGLAFDGGASQMYTLDSIDFSRIQGFELETEIVRGYSAKVGYLAELGKNSNNSDYAFALMSPCGEDTVRWSSGGEIVSTSDPAYAPPKTLQISLSTFGPVVVNGKELGKGTRKTFTTERLYVGRREGTGNGFKGTMKYLKLKAK